MTQQQRNHLAVVPSVRANPDKLMPHDDVGERALIASILLDERVIDLVLDLIRPEDFYDKRLGIVFFCAAEMRRAGARVGLTTVVSYLRDRGLLERVGGAAFVGDIARQTAVVAHAVQHAEDLALTARVRNVITTCQKIEAEGLGDVGDKRAWIESAERRMSSISESIAVRTSVGIRKSVAQAMEAIGLAAARKGQITGLPTQLYELDRLTAGLHGAEVTLVGGETGRGKSALAGCIAVNVASQPRVEVVPYDGGTLEINVPVGVAVFSLEMPHEDLSQRMACAQGHVDFQRVRNGDWNDDEYDALVGATRFLETLPIEFDDDPDLTVTRMQAKAARIEAAFARQGVRLGLIVIDYAQLMDASEAMEKGATRERQLSELARRIKLFSRAFRARPRGLLSWEDGRTEDLGYLEPSKVAVMLLTQLNEDGDPRESKALQMHADNFWVLEHVKDGKPSGPARTLPATVWIRKQRKGPRNVRASTWWHEAWTLFSDEEQPR